MTIIITIDYYNNATYYVYYYSPFSSYYYHYYIHKQTCLLDVTITGCTSVSMTRSWSNLSHLSRSHFGEPSLSLSLSLSYKYCFPFPPLCFRRGPSDDEGTVEEMFAEGFSPETPENEQFFTQHRFSHLFNSFNATIGVVWILCCH